MLSCLLDLVMALTIDHQRQVGRLVMLEFDSALLAQYVVDDLPRDHGVVAAEDGGDIDEDWLPRRPAYRLLVELAGREIGQQRGVDFVVLRSSRRHGDTDRVIAREPHFAWDADARKVVRRTCHDDT